MKIGMLTGLWYIAFRATVFESLERVAALGFRYVDLHGVFHAGPAHLSADERKAIRPALDRLGLSPRNYVLHARHNIPSASPAEREDDLAYLRQGIDCAEAWGIRQLMLNAGQWSSAVGRKDAWQRSVGFLQELCEYAERKSIFVVQEPEPYVWFLVQDLASAQQMMRDIARPNFTLLADLGHMALAREGLLELMPLSTSIIHAHLSDHQPYLHTNQVIGTGSVATADYVAALEHLDVDRTARSFGFPELVISFELGVPGDRISDPDDWVVRSLAHVQATIPQLGVS